MIRPLSKSSDRTRFIKLNTFFSIIALLFFLTGSSFAYAQSNQITTNVLKEYVLGEDITQVTRTFPPKVVTIHTRDSEETVFIYARTIQDVLDISGYEIDYNDITTPSLDEIIVSGGVIEIIEVEIEVYTEEKELPFETNTQESESYSTGSYVTEVEGVLGASTDTIRIIYKDGIATKKEVIKTEITKEPVTKEIRIGTKPVTIASCEYWGDVVDNVVPENNQTKREWFKYTMWRETGCDSGKESYGGGTFKGLMQFLPSTFYTRQGGTDIWDGYEQILIASRMYDEKMAFGEAGWTYLQSQWPTATKEFRAGARY